MIAQRVADRAAPRGNARLHGPMERNAAWHDGAFDAAQSRRDDQEFGQHEEPMPPHLRKSFRSDFLLSDGSGPDMNSILLAAGLNHNRLDGLVLWEMKVRNRPLANVGAAVGYPQREVNAAYKRIMRTGQKSLAFKRALANKIFGKETFC